MHHSALYQFDADPCLPCAFAYMSHQLQQTHQFLLGVFDIRFKSLAFEFIKWCLPVCLIAQYVKVPCDYDFSLKKNSGHTMQVWFLIAILYTE